MTHNALTTNPSTIPIHTSKFTLPAGALDFARELAHETGQFLKGTFGQIEASKKKDGTLVTESDLESDRRLSQAILSRYPDHTIISEEREKLYNGQEWCWVIDPIDGTTNFTWGFPLWGVLIGLLHHGMPVMGVADFPITDEHYSAALGQGAWRNGQPIHVSTATQLESTHLFAMCTRSLKQGRPDLICKTRIAGSTGFDLATLARGALVGAMELRVYLWDVAAVWPIVQEAGGTLMTNRNPERDIFPLQVGTDYGNEEFSVLGASSTELLSEFRARLSDRFAIQ